MFWAGGDESLLTHEETAQACKRYGSSVLRRCRAMLRDEQAAEDVAQEVFVQLASKGHTFRGDADLSTWLYRVATNLCLNRLRGDKRRDTREQSETVVAWSDIAPHDPYEQYAAKRLLQEIVRRLDPLAQSIFVLRYMDGMTQEEIAEVTGKSRRTVAGRIKKIEATVAEVGAVS